MKRGNSKTCNAVSQQGCGVWLDTTELRAKKQRKLIRPISKLLNPLARSGGYSMAVALNFTQTKMEMPATKQSRISSFFVPQSKKGSEESSSSWPSRMSSTSISVAHSGTKRKHEPQEYETDIERVSQVCNNNCNKEQQFLHLIWGYQSEEREPAEKKPCENIKTKMITDTQTGLSESIKHGDGSEEIPESLLHTDETQQYSHKNFHMDRNMCGGNSNGSSASLSTGNMYTQDLVKQQCFKETRGLFLTRRSPIEIQNMTNYNLKSNIEPVLFKQQYQWSPVKTEDKENRTPTSPRTNVALSPMKHHVYCSPASQIGRKLCQTPKKSIGASREKDEDSFGMLFTQDSEGFRVIAHRNKQSRCPLKEQTNCLSSPFVMPLDTESSYPEPEMLFTLDSQGNLVIKH